MSEIKLAVPTAQPTTESQAPAPGATDFRSLTELELMLAGGGEQIDPWP